MSMITVPSLLGVALCVGVVHGSSYALVDTYDSSNFFSNFDFFTGADPTNGFVTYVDAATANKQGLAGFTQGAVYLGVDYKTNSTTKGRSSVRVSSKKSYTTALILADMAHMPAGPTAAKSCGLWPAFWTFGPDWPNSGEIDIIEGVNSQQSNQITLHTSNGCNMTNVGSASGTILASGDCEGNSGCGQTTTATDNYGAGLNAAGGGVYAMEWTDSAISVWFFPRDSTTVSRLGNSTSTPDPSSFGTPLARFAGGAGCNIASHFMNHSIVLDMTFCGDWAGQAWASDAVCSALADSCESYVGNNAAAFTDAYWLINSIRVFSASATAA